MTPKTDHKTPSALLLLSLWIVGNVLLGAAIAACHVAGSPHLAVAVWIGAVIIQMTSITVAMWLRWV